MKDVKKKGDYSMNKVKEKMNLLQDRVLKISADEISKRTVYGTSAGLTLSSIIGSVMIANADELDNAKSRFKTFVNNVGGWVVIAGVIVTLAGVIQFGMGWMRDDPELRSKSAFTILGGIIIAAGFGIAKTLANYS